MSSQGTKNLDSGFNESANILLNLWNSAGVPETLGRKKGWRNLVFFSVIFHGPRLMAVVELQRSSFRGWSKTLHGGGRSCRRVKALSSLSPQAFTLSFRSKKKRGDVPRFAAVWGLGCDLIHYFRKIPKSPCCSPNPALLHPIQNSHWTFLSVLTPKYPKNPCEESDPNPDLPHKSWELQELRGLLSTTDSSRFALRERFETP